MSAELAGVTPYYIRQEWPKAGGCLALPGRGRPAAELFVVAFQCGRARAKFSHELVAPCALAHVMKERGDEHHADDYHGEEEHNFETDRAVCHARGSATMRVSGLGWRGHPVVVSCECFDRSFIGGGRLCCLEVIRDVTYFVFNRNSFRWRQARV